MTRRQFIQAGALLVPASYARAQWNVPNRRLSFLGTGLANGLSVYYKFDSNLNEEIQGLTLTDSGNGDYSFSGGIINNCTRAGITSNSGQSHVSNAAYSVGGGGWSISFWILPETDENGRTFVSKWNPSGAQEWWVNQTGANSNPRLRVKDLGGSAVDVTATGAIGQYVWSHIAAGFDPARKQIWIQLNNGTRYTTACSGISTDTADFVVGNTANFSGVTNLYGCRVDELGIWKRSLSTDEVAALYSGGAGWAYPFTITRGATEANTWAAKVVTNGGAAPSTASKIAIGSFWDGIIADGLWNTLKMVNAIAPDNLIAALTPIRQGTGNSPWTNHSFVAGDLTINGLAGDASTKYAETGIVPSTCGIGDNSAGIVLYCSSDIAPTGKEDFGSYDGLGGGVLFVLDVHGPGFACWNFAGGNIISWSLPAQIEGYYSGQRTASNALDIYYANSTNPHGQLAPTNTTAKTVSLVNGYPMLAWANSNTGSPVNLSAKRFSFFAVTTGLSAAQSAKLYNRVYSLRRQFGGGYV